MQVFDEIGYGPRYDLEFDEVSMTSWGISGLSEEEQDEVSNRYQEAEDNAKFELASFLGESR